MVSVKDTVEERYQFHAHGVDASGIMQETKVGKEMILIVIKGWEGCILG